MILPEIVANHVAIEQIFGFLDPVVEFTDVEVIADESQNPPSFQVLWVRTSKCTLATFVFTSEFSDQLTQPVFQD